MKEIKAHCLKVDRSIFTLSLQDGLRGLAEMLFHLLIHLFLWRAELAPPQKDHDLYQHM